ncbi:MAG: flagellar basal body P-ring formation protein FlgA [Alphaproteobacteria bacterium]|nr:flagellar basal body P-ring formation protein FlgA [Alphaproteobacteria bacterium]
MSRTPLTRKILMGLLAAGSLLAATIYPLTASAIGLKQNSVINGDVIHLGDVFHGLPEGAEKVLGPAPQPGREMVLNARTLMRIAIALDLPWRPQHSDDSVTLKRAATVIGHDTIENLLKSSLEKQGVSGNYRLALATGNNRGAEIILPQDMPATAEITQIDYKPESGYFEATLAAPSSKNPIDTLQLSGTIERMASIPVLKESLGRGVIIGTGDIDFIQVPEKSLRQDIVLRAEDLDGMTPRNIIPSGQPVKLNDVQSPRVVDRGDIVTMVFNGGGMLLTAQGKALENGAKGDHIRVTNTASSKTVVAEVTGGKEVTIRDF